MDDFKQISARFKQANQTAEDDAPRVSDFNESLRIRAKMVGVLLRDARLKAGRSLENCAQMLRTSAEQVENWEYGDEAPSLPQLELLAFYLDVPISHFWGVDTLEATGDNPVSAQTEYLILRDRMIGALLRLAREDASVSLESISEQTGMPAEQIAQYESGEVSVPMHELTVLSNALRKNISYFLESGSHLGDWLAMREEWKEFTHLPQDLRRFAANPINVGFLEIAVLFSQMPADKLRRVGESVLNISM
ncbi:MAG: helix-turn-helix transcriptional regulator [Anaerolineae bacterium]|nr:helix-turn-helix transcriptional regulator [Anaerolineae bacterium]